MRKFWMISRDDSERRLSPERVLHRLSTLIPSWWVDLLSCYNSSRFDRILPDQPSIRQLCDDALPCCRRSFTAHASSFVPSVWTSISLLRLIRPTLSYQRLHTQEILNDQELYEKIRKTAQNKYELQVLESFLIFNKHVLKTNFYQPTKVALSFRLAPDFLPEVEYPKKPFGMFFIIGVFCPFRTVTTLSWITDTHIGNEFRGFHIRFRDVARGGIRIVMSRNREWAIVNHRIFSV